MGTEDELRERAKAGVLNYLKRHEGALAIEPGEIGASVLAALGIPLPVLSWITANPEAAKGLASGEMVAMPKTKPEPQFTSSSAIAFFCPICGQFGGGSTGYHLSCDYRDRPHCLAVNPWPGTGKWVASPPSAKAPEHPAACECEACGGGIAP